MIPTEVDLGSIERLTKTKTRTYQLNSTNFDLMDDAVPYRAFKAPGSRWRSGNVSVSRPAVTGMTELRARFSHLLSPQAMTVQ